jgi:hypothetical protein
MQLSRVLFFAALGLCRARASPAEPGTDVSVHRPSNDIIEINIQIEVDNSPAAGGASRTAHNTTRSSQQGGSSSLVTGFATGALCGAVKPTSVHNRTLWLSTAATRGSPFTNSTASASATGSFRTPSQIEFAPFFSGSALASQIDMLSVWSVAGLSCAMSVFF